MIDQQTITRILDAARIEEVVSDFVTLRKRGVNYIGLCPFHDEKTGSFTVSPAKGIFKCFGCGKGGGPVHFIMEHEQLDYPGALRYLAKKYHIEIVEKEQTAEERQNQSDRESLFALNNWAQTYFVDKLHNSEDGRAIGISYFHSRGFTDATIEKFGLGYCTDNSDTMSLAALQAGYKADFIEKTGLGIHRENGSWYDRFRGRVIFPVHSLSGKIVAFGGRILQKNDKAAKYVNSPESEIYHKSNELYGIYFAKQSIVKADRCYLVEGYTDVISMHQSGVTNAVASSGTSLTSGQIRLIHRFTQNITVLYDGDPAGIKASLRGIDLLLEEGMNVKVVLLPDGEDPDSYAQTHNASDFIDFIDKNQVDFIRFKINLLIGETNNDPIRRAELISDVTRSVALIPDAITRSVYIHETATQLSIEESIIASEVQKILRDKRSKELARRSEGDYTPYRYSTDKSKTTAPAYRSESSAVKHGQGQQEQEIQEQRDKNAISSPQKQEDKYPFDIEEKNILYYIIRNGNEIIGELPSSDKTEPVFITVSDYIADSLSDLEKGFHNPLYQKIIDETKGFELSGNTDTQKYFANHPDPSISLLAAELLTDRDIISRMFTKYDDYIGDPNDLAAIKEHEQKLEIQRKETLMREIFKVIHEYKLAIIRHREKEIDIRIGKAQNAGAIETVMQLLKEKQNILILKKALADCTDGRVVLGCR